MKKSITKALTLIFSVGMFVSIVLSFFLNVHMDVKNFKRTADENFCQIERIIEENNVKLAAVREDFKETSIVRARAVAYISRHFPQMIEDLKECRRVAELLQVDEIHFFTTDGVIYAGTHPEYYNYSFSSGEQMAFFAPMLKDKKLELCQDIMPNTAKQEPMQYTAVWSRDGERIVQVGMNPERVLKEIERNRISDIFELVSVDPDTTLLAIDIKNRMIEGSTEREQVGKSLFGLDEELNEIQEETVSGSCMMNGRRYYYAAQKSGELVLVKLYPKALMLENSERNIVLLFGYFLLLFVALIAASYQFLNRKIVRSIDNINDGLKRIEGGDTELLLHEDSEEEFSQLCGGINQMVSSLRTITEKIAVERDTDFLTGLYNRRAFYDLTENAFKQPEKLGQAIMAVMDLDNLKKVNDSFGHACGDKYLNALAKHLASFEYPNRIAARVGGDEFALFIWNLGEKELQDISDRLSLGRGVRELDMNGGETVLLEYSVGCAVYPDEGKEFLGLFKLADERMYEDKEKRKSARK